jgi:hypothetical protein
MSEKSFSDQLRSQARDLRGGVITGGDLRAIADQIDQAADSIELSDDIHEARRFSHLMIAKLAKAQHKGKRGWRNVPVDDLWSMLLEHIEKGDPIDIAIFAMMIHHQTEAAPE